MNKNTSSSGLQQLLVCPLCKGEINFLKSEIECKCCDLKFSQMSEEWFDLMPPNHLLKDEATQWEERLQEMESWYNDLMTNPTHANYCFLSEKNPYAPVLATLSGDILDIGGGNGLPRNYLPDSVRYFVIDPSLDWLKTDWSSLAENFPCLKEKPDFVRGVGEYLPFSSKSFDAILSFMSLNHASDPKQVLTEVARVLRPGGRFLLVVEDIIPQWLDIVDPSFPSVKVFDWFFYQEPGQKRFRILDRIRLKLSGITTRIRLFLKLLRGEKWPLQKDHIRIHEVDIKNWSASDFKIVKRVWVDEYLMFEFQRMSENEVNS